MKDVHYMLTKSDLNHIDNITKAMSAYYKLFNILSNVELTEGRDSPTYKQHLDYLTMVMFECDQRFIDYYPSEEKAKELINYFTKKYDIEHPKEIDKTLINAIDLNKPRQKIIFSAILNRLYHRYANPTKELFHRLDYDLNIFNSSKFIELYNFEKANYIIKPCLIEESLKIFLSFLDESYSHSNNDCIKQYLLQTKYDLSFIDEKLSRKGSNLKFNFANPAINNIDNFALLRNVSLDNLNEIKNNFGKDIVSNCIYKLWTASPEKFNSDKELASYMLYINWFKTGTILLDSYALNEVKNSFNDFNRIAKSTGNGLSKKVIKDVQQTINSTPQCKKKILI